MKLGGKQSFMRYLQIKRNLHESGRKGLLECKIPKLKLSLFCYYGDASSTVMPKTIRHSLRSEI